MCVLCVLYVLPFSQKLRPPPPPSPLLKSTGKTFTGYSASSTWSSLTWCAVHNTSPTQGALQKTLASAAGPAIGSGTPRAMGSSSLVRQGLVSASGVHRHIVGQVEQGRHAVGVACGRLPAHPPPTGLKPPPTASSSALRATMVPLLRQSLPRSLTACYHSS